MSEVADLVADLKKGMPAAFKSPEATSKPKPRPKMLKKTKKAPSFTGLFESPRKKRQPRLRCSFDLELELAERFKGICSSEGFQQREIIEGFVRAFVEHHSP